MTFSSYKEFDKLSWNQWCVVPESNTEKNCPVNSTGRLFINYLADTKPILITANGFNEWFKTLKFHDEFWNEA